MFSGAGGSSEAFKQLGIESVGYEIDKFATATALANENHTILQDVTTLNPEGLPSGLGLFVQASPPCQGLSTAGKMTGRNDIKNLVSAMHGNNVVYNDHRSKLMLEILRWTHAADYIMLEQVPAALEVWQEIEKILQLQCFNTWSGVLRTEQFGIAQSRRRAFLLASRNEFSIPAPTHSKFYNRDPDKIDGQSWVSVSDVLELDQDSWLGFPRRSDGNGEVIINGIAYRSRDLRQCKYPAFALTEKARSWMVDQKQLTPTQAGMLQGFDKDYTWVGSRTSKFLQIGNALPPRMAKVLIEALTSS